MTKLLLFIFILVINTPVFAQKEYNSLFWEISGNGLTEPSYLYGTMHTQDSRVFHFKEGVIEAFNSSDTYAMELNLDSINQCELMTSLIMDSTYSLKTLLSKKEYQLVETFFIDSLGQALFLFNKMQPMFTAQMISTRDLQKQQEEALDFHFFKKAKEQTKKIVGLETMLEQVQAFSSISYEEQAKGLVKAVKEYGKEASVSMDEIMEYYIKGDLNKLLEITESTEEDEEISKVFIEEFLLKRNYNMADRAVPLITKGSTFIAVGAAHLPGEEGVIELLRKKGYTVLAK